MTVGRVLRRALSAGLLALATCATFGVAGCYSPTLPLPPPGQPEQVGSVGPDGIVELRGAGAEPRSIVHAYDQTNGKEGGDTADSIGRYDIFLKAQPGDVVILYYDVGQDRSDSSEPVIIK